MRYIIAIVLFVFSTSIYSQEKCLLIDSVKVKFVSWDIVTDVSLGCANFESSIDYQVCSEKNSHLIHKLIKELDRLGTSEGRGEDIRCKLEFYHLGQICRLDCVGNILTTKESGYYYTSKKLKSIINRIINKNRKRIRIE